MTSPLEPVAIVGIGCRFPGGVDSPASFWRMLRDGVDAIAEIPEDRPELRDVYDPTPGTPGRIVARVGGFLSGLDQFDPSFFGISPREANAVDPQQRLLLETSWEAFEDAGIVPAVLAGKNVGVFIGMWTNEYEDRMFAANPDVDLYVTTGGGRYAASGRLSFAFDLRGPSLTLDTACSSSLVAVHLACQSLRSGECELALAGASNLILTPDISIGYSRSRMLSPDGHCKFGDASANGYVRSEGVGVLLLKPLSRALADGDRIHAVVRGSAVNNDGRSSGLLVAPGAGAQQDMLREAYENAGVDPARVGYVEAHGTGTGVGDPVELEALGAVLGQGRAPDQPCAMGSVKTNIGHCEAASGLAGLIKAALCLEMGQIPPSLHFHDPNPKIPWANLPLRMQTSLAPWPEDGRPAYAGVNSFGVTGTNAHVVLEGPPAHAPTGTRPRRTALLPLSAKTPEALRDQARAYRDFLAATDEESAAGVHDIGYTAGVRRTHHEHRLAVLGDRPGAMVEELDAFLAGRPAEASSGWRAGRAPSSQRPRVAFVFPGQGSQWLGMARELQKSEAAFRESLEACHEAVRGEVGWSLLDELLAPEGQTRMAEIDVVQPTLFAIQVALAALWRSWGVLPDAVVGHSMGEVAAAHVAGALSLQDAAAVICRRSRLLRRVSGQGAMAVVGLSVADAGEVLEGYRDRLSIAVSNGPTSTVLSGDPEALREVLDRLQARNVFCRAVQVNVASHSPQMDPLLSELGRELAGLQPGPPAVPMYSTVVGGRGEGLRLDHDYWCRNLRQPVMFAGAIERLLADGHGAFVEQSPHPILLPAIEGMLHHLGREGVVLPSMEREKPERRVALTSLGALHTLGVHVDWSHLYPEGRCVTLPAYPWQRKRYWLEGGKRPLAAEAPAHGHPVLGRALGAVAPLPGSRLWERTWPSGVAEDLEERLLGAPVFSAAALVKMALAAAAETFGPGEHAVLDLALDSVVALSDGGPCVLQTVLTPTAQGSPEASIRVFVKSAAETESAWTPAGRATVRRAEASDLSQLLPLADIRKRCTTVVSPDAHLAGLRERGIGRGQSGRLEELRLARGEALARMSAAPAREAAAGLLPAWSLQECFEILHAAARELGLAPGVPLVPTAVESFRGQAAPSDAVWVHAVAREGPPGELTGDVRLLDEGGRVVAEAQGVRFQAAESPSLAAAVAERVAGLRYEVLWREQPLHASASRAGAGASWLILADRGGVGSALAALLRARGDRCLLAFAGAPPEMNGDLGIDPQEASAVERLVSAAEPGARGGVVHLWGLDAPLPSDTGPLGDAPLVGCLSAMLAAQALARSRTTPSRMWLVTRGAEPVTEAAGAGLCASPIWGFGRVLALERPENWGGLVDLEPAAAEGEAQALLTELDHGGDEDQVAFRGERRYVARLARVSARPRVGSVDWRRDGSYLITGGLGGLGLQIARWMASRGAGHIVLTGRSGLPARSEWDRLAPETKAAKQVAAIRALEAKGAAVTVLAADAGDETAMGALFDSFGKSLPPLRGVVHAAGILATEPIDAFRPDTLRAVLHPKVEGAWTLHRRSQGQPLDFFVLFSSGASIWGSKGFAHYAAANHFQDALAHTRRAAGLPALSVNWGFWAGGGITGDEEGRFFRQIGLEMIPSGQAFSALEVLLGEGAIQGTVADVRWEVFKPIYESRGRRPFLAEIDPGVVVEAGTQGAASDLLERLATARPGDRRELLAIHVATSVAAILGFDSVAAIERQRGFFKMGMDSIMTVQLRNRLERELGRKLPPTVAFEYPTVDALAAFLVGEMFPSAAPPPAAPDEVEATEAEDLSEDELTVLLAERLRQSR